MIKDSSIALRIGEHPLSTEREMPIDLSNVMPIDPETKRPTRVGAKILDDGTRVRVAVRSGAVLDK